MHQLPQQLANGIMTGSIYGILAVGLALMYGVLEIAQFAIGALAMVASYSVFETAPRIGYVAAVIVGVLVVASLGVAIQLIIFGPLRSGPSVNMFVAAFGLVLILQGVALSVFGPNTRVVKEGIRGGAVIFGIHLTYQRLLVVAIALIVFGLLTAMLRWTSLGRSIRAVGQNQIGALAVGISPRWIAIVVAAIGSGLAGLAGGLLAPIADVYPTVGDDLVIKAFIIVVVAGMGSIAGALVCSYLVGMVEAVGASVSLDYTDLYPLALLVLILALRPQGLFGKMKTRT